MNKGFPGDLSIQAVSVWLVPDFFKEKFIYLFCKITVKNVSHFSTLLFIISVIILKVRIKNRVSSLENNFLNPFLSWWQNSFIQICMRAKSFQSCLTLCDHLDCSPLCSSVHGILQARMGCHSPGDLSDPGIEPRSPALQADSLPSKPPGKPLFKFTVKL